MSTLNRLLSFSCVFTWIDAWPQPELVSEGYWRSVGNHRYVISIPATAPPRAAYTVTLPWRRSDPSPEMKGTVLLDAISAQPVANCRRLTATREVGSFAFTGSPGGVYHLYYMPFVTCEFVGGACQFGQTDDVEGMVQYAAFNGSCSDDVWWESGGTAEVAANGPEARTEFDRFGPMEVAATSTEAAALMKKAGKLLLVAEDRSNPIRMRHHLPLIWATRAFDELAHFHGYAQPGEAYSFQVGMVVSEAAQLLSATLRKPLFGPGNTTITPASLRCLNIQGVDFWGRDFTKTKALSLGEVHALWFMLDFPGSTPHGQYTGSIVFETSFGVHSVALSFDVRGPALDNRGYDDLWRNARLSWLDSTLGNENDVPPPFQPLGGWHNRSVHMLDKVVTFSPEGMPSSVKVGHVEALAAPMRFEILVDGIPVEISGNTSFHEDGNLVHSWNTDAVGKGVHFYTKGSIDATGFLDLNVSLDTSMDHEIRLVVSPQPAVALYAAGLGRYGGLLRRWTNGSTPVTWYWDGINHNNGVWVGSTKAGIRVYPKGSDPLWQAQVPFDSDVAPATPESWSNHGAGGIRVWPNGTIEVFTGLRKAGKMSYLFSVMATPTRPLDLPKHFSERYAQISQPVNYSYLQEGGATVVNVHQGNILNPWINYPYLTNNLIKQAVDECHALGMKLKLYDTMRELSNHAQELDAMRALNETFVWREGVGGGGDWLREHLHVGYSVAWATPMKQRGWFSQEVDMAMKVNALSRWNNYYIEGLRQLVRDTNFDGIYLDEIAYDRVTMLRAKAVLGRDRLIDHHSCRGQFAKVPAVVYAESFPFIDRLWYGEGFDYDEATADHWLVEISGIPWGLNSDLLRYSGMTPFHFRGMLFGSANRWQDDLINSQAGLDNPFDPRAIWKLWDSFGIASSTMYGWWLDEEGPGNVPVTPNSSDVKCTTFLKKGKGALVVLANFGSAQAVRLKYDWEMLGLAASDVHLRAPPLQPMQPEEHIWSMDDAISVPSPENGSKSSREGWLILLEKHAGTDALFV